jgi:hypothetical protein
MAFFYALPTDSSELTALTAAGASYVALDGSNRIGTGQMGVIDSSIYARLPNPAT